MLHTLARPIADGACAESPDDESKILHILMWRIKPVRSPQLCRYVLNIMGLIGGALHAG